MAQNTTPPEPTLSAEDEALVASFAEGLLTPTEVLQTFTVSVEITVPASDLETTDSIEEGVRWALKLIYDLDVEPRVSEGSAASAEHLARLAGIEAAAAWLEERTGQKYTARQVRIHVGGRTPQSLAEEVLQ